MSKIQPKLSKSSAALRLFAPPDVQLPSLPLVATPEERLILDHICQDGTRIQVVAPILPTDQFLRCAVSRGNQRLTWQVHALELQRSILPVLCQEAAEKLRGGIVI